MLANVVITSVHFLQGKVYLNIKNTDMWTNNLYYNLGLFDCCKLNTVFMVLTTLITQWL